MLNLSLNAPHLDPVMVMCDPDQLDAWLQHLPYTQPFDCAQLIRDALGQLNCIKLPPSSRLQLLRLYLQAQDRLLPVLEAEARPGELTSYGKARTAALLAQHLSILIHNGFKRVLLDRSHEHGLFALDRHKIEALNLTMLSARQLAMLYARSYTVPPPGFWRDCHQIFLYATSHGWESRAFSDKEDNIGSLYRQLLLLGMTSCNRMEPALIDYTLLLIRKYAKTLHLVQVDRLPERQGAFAYHCDHDSPPRFYSELPAQGQLFWLVDTQQLQHELLEKMLSLQRLLQNRSDDTVLAEELQRVLSLIQAWQSAPQRHYPRHDSYQQVSLVTLLPTCWFIANGASWDFPAPLQDGMADGPRPHHHGESQRGRHVAAWRIATAPAAYRRARHVACTRQGLASGHRTLGQSARRRHGNRMRAGTAWPAAGGGDGHARHHPPAGPVPHGATAAPCPWQRAQTHAGAGRAPVPEAA